MNENSEKGERMEKIMMKYGFEVSRRELVPNDSHKSFYRKAWIIECANGVEALQSYDTIVAVRVNGRIYRTWEGWSATTGRHIAAWCGLNKAAYLALPEDSGIACVA